MDQKSIDALGVQLVAAFSHQTDGKHVPASDGGTMDILSPINGQVLTQVARGTATDMEAAIASARAAFEDLRWAGQPSAARKKAMMKRADLIDANALDLGFLAGAVWTRNLSRAHRMVGAVRTGMMHVNTYGGADGTVPLGGVRQSRNGSDKSQHAIEKHINRKAAWIKL